MSYPRHPRLSWWWAVRCLGCEGLIWYIQAKSMTWYSQIRQRVFSITILRSHIAKPLGLTSTFEAFGLGVSFQAGKRPVLKSLHATTPTRLYRSAGKWHPSPQNAPWLSEFDFSGSQSCVECCFLYEESVMDWLILLFESLDWKLHVAHLVLFKSFFGGPTLAPSWDPGWCGREWNINMLFKGYRPCRRPQIGSLKPMAAFVAETH